MDDLTPAEREGVERVLNEVDRAQGNDILLKAYLPQFDAVSFRAYMQGEQSAGTVFSEDLLNGIHIGLDYIASMTMSDHAPVVDGLALAAIIEGAIRDAVEGL